MLTAQSSTLSITLTSRRSPFGDFTSGMCLPQGSYAHNRPIKGSRTHLRTLIKLAGRLRAVSPYSAMPRFSFWILCRTWTAQIASIILPQARPSYYLIRPTCLFCFVQFWDIVPPLPLPILWRQNMIWTVSAMEGQGPDWRRGLHERSGGSWNRLRRLRPPLRGNSNGLLDSSCAPLLQFDFHKFVRSQIDLIGYTLQRSWEPPAPQFKSFGWPNLATQYSSPSTFYFHVYKTFGIFFCLTGWRHWRHLKQDIGLTNRNWTR
jgi:hypothetical protein